MNSYFCDGRLTKEIKVEAPCRASTAGNPSDLIRQAEEKAREEDLLIEVPGDGWVLSIPVWSLTASVTLKPSKWCRISSPRSRFSSHKAFDQDLRRRGIGDWEYIADQTMLVVGDMLQQIGVELVEVPFLIKLSTNIPRQRGVSGSSGMILALMEAILIAYGVQDQFSVVEKAVNVLSVETTLGVTAGLQDRILQAAAMHNPSIGAVFMDFSREAKDKTCSYETIETQMPPMALVLSEQPSHSGKMHQPILQRMIDGDTKLIKRFSAVGRYAIGAKDCIESGNLRGLGVWMNQTAEARIEIYGEDTLGPDNMALVAACRAAGCPFNFTGSGGAVVALLPDDDDSYRRLSREIKKRGKFTIFRI